MKMNEAGFPAVLLRYESLVIHFMYFCRVTLLEMLQVDEVFKFFYFDANMHNEEWFLRFLDKA